MLYPLDHRVLELMSVFDDGSVLGSHRYSPTSSCEGRRYTHKTRTGRLDVTVWIHSGTAWVSLEGLLSRRAAHALATVLKDLEASRIVLNTAAMLVSMPHGGTPLLSLCATLSSAGHSVAVVGALQDADDAPTVVDVKPSSQAELLLLRPIA